MSVARVLRGCGSAPGVIQTLDSFNSKTAPSAFTINADGTYALGTDSGSYVLPAAAGVAARYQVKVDVSLGAFNGGSATATWLDCSSAPSWTRSSPQTINFTVTFREKATQIVRSPVSNCQLQVL